MNNDHPDPMRNTVAPIHDTNGLSDRCVGRLEGVGALDSLADYKRLAKELGARIGPAEELPGFECPHYTQPTDPDPKHAHLSRVDLEVAVSYWQPRAMAMARENDKLKTEARAYRKLGFWGRVKWLFKGR